MKPCRRIRRSIERSFDGRLSLDEEFRVEEHVAECERCRGLYEQVRVLRDALHGLPAPPAERLDVERSLDAVRRAIDARATAAPTRRFPWRSIAAAAALVLALAAWALRDSMPAPSVADRTPREVEPTAEVAALDPAPVERVALELLVVGPDDAEDDEAPTAEALAPALPLEPAGVLDPEFDAARLARARQEVRRALLTHATVLAGSPDSAAVQSFADALDDELRTVLAGAWPVRRLVEGLLTAEEPEVGRAAARYLGVRGDRVAVAALEEALARPDRRGAAVLALADAGERGLDVLSRAVWDPELAPLVLDQIGTRPAHDGVAWVQHALRRAPRTPSATTEVVMGGLLELLTGCGEEGADTLLLLSDHALVSEADVLDALARTGGADEAVTRAVLFSSRPPASEEFLLRAVARLRPAEALAWVDDLCRAPGADPEAARVLASFDGDAAAAALLDLCASGRVRDEDVPELWQLALGRGPDRFETLAHEQCALADRLVLRRYLDLLVLAEHADAVPAILVLAGSPDLGAEDRERAILVAGEVGEERHVMALAELFTQLDRTERELAAACLFAAYTIGGPEAARTVLASAASRTPRPRPGFARSALCARRQRRHPVQAGPRAGAGAGVARRRTLENLSMITALVLSLLPTSGDAAEAAENVLRVYDLSSVAASHEEEQDPFDVVLLPFLRLHYEMDDDIYSEVEEGGGAEGLVDLITNLYGDEFDYEGRTIHLGAKGKLAVRGPEALHQRIDELISFFDQSINAQVDLLVDVVRFAPGAGAAVPAGSVIDAAEAESWLGGAAQGAERESYRVSLRSDRATVLDMTRNVAALVDYDVEIAQGSAIADPITGSAVLGTRLALRGAAGNDGLFLALSWRRGDETPGASSRELNSKLMIASADEQVTYVGASPTVENLQVAGRAAGLNTYLPDGKALVLHTDVGLSRYAVEEVIVLRVAGGGLAGQRTLAFDDRGVELVVADLGSLSPPRCVATGALLWPGYVPEHLSSRLWRRTLLATQLWRGEEDFHVDVLLEGVRYLTEDRMGRWLVTRPDGSGGPPEAIAAEQRLLRSTFAALQPDPGLVDLSFRLTRAGGEGPAADIGARFPVRLGESCTVVLGIEELEVRDYDVEVAQYAATADPIVFHAFDGLALWARPERDPKGGMLIEVRGGGHLLLGREALPLGIETMPFVDQSDFAHLFVSERVRMQRGDDGRWRTVFGLAGGGGTSEPLQLVVEVGM